MKKLHLHKFIFIFLVMSLVASSCGLIKSHSTSRKAGKQMAGPSRRSVKIREPRQVVRAKKKADDRERKQKKNYAKAVESSRKRAYEIQSPDVKARMKQNEVNISIRDKEKAKRTRTASKKAGKKYR